MPNKQGGKRRAKASRGAVEVHALDPDDELPPVQEVDADHPGAADEPTEVEEDEESSVSSSSDDGERKQEKKKKKKTKKKTCISYTWTSEDKELLAAFFEEYPMFYNSYLEEFKDTTAKREVVKQFVKEKFEDKGRPAPTCK